jgi:hypothetical protein
VLIEEGRFRWNNIPPHGAGPGRRMMPDGASLLAAVVYSWPQLERCGGKLLFGCDSNEF